jgi:hypothetical protein
MIQNPLPRDRLLGLNRRIATAENSIKRDAKRKSIGTIEFPGGVVWWARRNVADFFLNP